MMAKRLVLAVLIVASVASCARVAESRLNPFNWFGRDRGIERAERVEVETVRDPRPLVEQVTSVSLDRAPGGAILRAVGVPATQGHWAAELVLDGTLSTPDRLIYQFRAAPPLDPAPISTDASRQVVVATFLTDQRLARVREVQVLGALSSRAVRR